MRLGRGRGTLCRRRGSHFGLLDRPRVLPRVIVEIKKKRARLSARGCLLVIRVLEISRRVICQSQRLANTRRAKYKSVNSRRPSPATGPGT